MLTLVFPNKSRLIPPIVGVSAIKRRPYTFPQDILELGSTQSTLMLWALYKARSSAIKYDFYRSGNGYDDCIDCN